MGLREHKPISRRALNVWTKSSDWNLYSMGTSAEHPCDAFTIPGSRTPYQLGPFQGARLCYT